jgi:hypothetical protein
MGVSLMIDARKVKMKRSINSQQNPHGIVITLPWSKLRTSLTLPVLALTLAVTALPLRTAARDDKPTADCTGTWKVTQYSTNTQARSPELTLKLKLNEGTLTGTLGNVSISKHKSRAKEWPIKEAKLQGDEISFTVTHPFEAGEGDVTSIYQGKINGDNIKGTFKVVVLGQTFTRSWEAERLGDLPPITSNPATPR